MGRSYVWYYSQSNATFGIDNWCRTSNSSWCKICIFSHPVNHISFADRKEEISRSSLTWKDLLWTPWWSVRSGSLLRTTRWCTCNPTPRCGRTGWTWWCPWRLGWGKTPGGWGWFNHFSKVDISLPGIWVLGIIRLVFEWKVSPCSTLATGLSLWWIKTSRWSRQASKLLLLKNLTWLQTPCFQWKLRSERISKRLSISLRLCVQEGDAV